MINITKFEVDNISKIIINPKEIILKYLKYYINYSKTVSKRFLLFWEKEENINKEYLLVDEKSGEEYEEIGEPDESGNIFICNRYIYKRQADLFFDNSFTYELAVKLLENNRLKLIPQIIILFENKNINNYYFDTEKEFLEFFKKFSKIVKIDDKIYYSNNNGKEDRLCKLSDLLKEYLE